MAGEAFLYSERLHVEEVPAAAGVLFAVSQLVEWVPSPVAAVTDEKQFVEWVPVSNGTITAETTFVEWCEIATGVVTVERQIVEWEPINTGRVQDIRQLVEFAPPDMALLLDQQQLVEWIQGNDLWAEPGVLAIEGGQPPIMAIVKGEGTGEEIKELARYQLSDPDSGSDEPVLFVDPETPNFEGGPLPPGGVTLPPHGTGHGAESRYREKDGSPIVGPDLVD